MGQEGKAGELPAASGSPFSVRGYRSDSATSVLVRRLFNAGQLGLEPVNWEESRTMLMLLKAGLVTAANVKCPITGCFHVMYSLTIAGRASYAAEELGLSFPQLCYLACARRAMRHSLFSPDSAFFDKDLRPMFNTFFPELVPLIARKALTRKGFLEKRASHVFGMTRRLAEVEEKYRAIMDELYGWMRTEYKIRFLEGLKDPLIGRMLGSTSRLPSDGQDEVGPEEEH